MSQPSPPCKLYGEFGLGLLIVAWRYFFWPAQNFCAAAEVFAPQNLWKSRNRLCRRYRYMYLGGYRWVNKSVGLRTKHHDTEVDHDSTLSADADGQQLHLIPWKFAHCKSFTKSFQSWSFSAWVLSCSVQTNQKRGPVLVRTARRKEANLRIFAPPCAICMRQWYAWRVWHASRYMQMNRCQGGKSSRLCRRTGSFPVVTVTNLFANRSTLNSCNFVISWRIELIFVALESWRVSFFNKVSFVAKRWGLKNHPRSLPWANVTYDCRDFTHQWIATKSDYRLFDITWCITTKVLFFFRVVYRPSAVRVPLLLRFSDMPPRFLLSTSLPPSPSLPLSFSLSQSDSFVRQPIWTLWC